MAEGSIDIIYNPVVNKSMKLSPSGFTIKRLTHKDRKAGGRSKSADRGRIKETGKSHGKKIFSSKTAASAQV